MAADLQVTVALLLEQEAEIARKLAEAGGQAGDQFSKSLSGEAQKAFNDLVKQADKAAKDVQVKFNQNKLRFETASGEAIPQRTLDQLARVNQKFGEAVQAVNTFRSALTQTARESQQSLNILESAITGVAISLTSRLTDGVGTALASVKGLVGGFLALDGELRLAAAAAGETGAYERLAAIVDKVGIEAAGTTKQVAELVTSLVRAGFSVKEIETALPGVVRGAEATGTGFAQFGDIVGNTLRGFQLDVEQTGHVVDVLVNTANSSNASIEGLGYTFEYTAPIAKALGVSLEEVAAAAGLMANAGIQGSVAGTGLRTGLQKIQQAAGGASPEVLGLARGQERLTGVMRKLGATVVDTNGKLLPLDQVFLRLKAGLEKLNQGDQVQLANILFGDEAGSKFLAILNQSDSAITKMFRDMKNSAGAADTARTAMSGMGLELQQLTGTLDSLGNTLGGVIGSGLRPLVGLANTVAGAVSGMPAPVKTTTAALIGLTAASTAAAIAVAGVNLAVGQVGGYAALGAAAKGAIASLSGFMAGGVIILGMAAALAVLTGNLRQADQTTKTLAVTSATLGAVILGWRAGAAIIPLISAAITVLNARLGTTVVLTGFLTSARSGLIAALAGAAIAGAVAFSAMNNNIAETGAETEALSTKANQLQAEVKNLEDEIKKSKKLNIDTKESEQKLRGIKSELLQIQSLLDLKVDKSKAESALKELESQRAKLESSDSMSGVLDARINAQKEFVAALKAVDSGNLAGLNENSKQFATQAKADREKLIALLNETIKLPVNSSRRKEIDKEIDGIQKRFDDKKISLKFKLNLQDSEAQIKRVIDQLKAIQDRETARKRLSVAPGPASSNPLVTGIDGRPQTNLDATNPAVGGLFIELNDKKQKIALEEQLKKLNLEKLNLQYKQVEANEKEVRKARELVVTAKEKLEIAKTKLETDQAAIANTDKLASLETSRLRTVQSVADAYLNLANAQAGLAQSEFDLQKSRNQAQQAFAEKYLQELRDRGAGVKDIYNAEQALLQLKQDGERLEFDAMNASIEATQKRFEIERRILELKQAGQILEQQSAIRAADQRVLSERGKLLELQSKLSDSSLLPEQKRNLQEQLKIQQDSLELSKLQAAAEREKTKQLAVIFGMESEAMAAQQQTAANQQRAAAAAKGWELALSGALDQLDEQPNKIRKTNTGWDYVQKSINKVLGSLKDHNKLLQEGAEKAGNLAKRYQEMNAPGKKGGKDAGGSPSPGGMSDSAAQARQGWKEVPNMGILEFSSPKVPKKITDAIIREVVGNTRTLERTLPDGTLQRKELQSNFVPTTVFDPKTRKATEIFDGFPGNLPERTRNMTADEQLLENWTMQQRAVRKTTEEVKSFEAATKSAAQVPESFRILDDYYKSIGMSAFTAADNTAQLGSAISNASGTESLNKLYQGITAIYDQTTKAKNAGTELGQAYADLWTGLQSGESTGTKAIKDGTDQAATGTETVAQGIDAAIVKTDDLASSWVKVYDAITRSGDALKVYSTPPAVARWAGGDAVPGKTYTINEIGMESFLDRYGNISRITAPPYSRWSPPSQGVVLPAGITSRLDAMGAFDRGTGSAGGGLAGSLMTSLAGVTTAGLQRSMDHLAATIRAHNPRVDVRVPGVDMSTVQNMMGL